MIFDLIIKVNVATINPRQHQLNNNSQHPVEKLQIIGQPIVTLHQASAIADQPALQPIVSLAIRPSTVKDTSLIGHVSAIIASSATHVPSYDSQLPTPPPSPDLYTAASQQEPSTPSLPKANPIIPAKSILTILTAAIDKPKTPRDLIILTTKTGERYEASRSILIDHSSVFGKTPDLRHLIMLVKGDNTLHLKSATPDGIAFILAYLTLHIQAPSFLHRAIIAYMPYLNSNDTRIIAEANKCARIYGFKSFLRSFVWGILDGPSYKSHLAPIPEFVVRAITMRRDRCRHQYPASRLLKLGIIQIPAEYQILLQQYTPEHIKGYADLYARYSQAYQDLKSDLKTEQMANGELSDYTDKHGGTNYDSFPSPCAAYLQTPDWQELRELAGTNVHSELGQGGKDPQNIEQIFEVVQETVLCKKCARRLTHTFLPAVRRFRAVAYSYTF